jgi:hypothetical protein
MARTMEVDRVCERCGRTVTWTVELIDGGDPDWIACECGQIVYGQHNYAEFHSEGMPKRTFPHNLAYAEFEPLGTPLARLLG